MVRCVLHFGMPKTGSSSIQETLFGHVGDSRLRYVHAGAANGSGMLATAFLANPQRFHVHRKLGLGDDEIARRREQYLAEMDRQLRTPADWHVLSGESLTHFRVADWRNLRRWLSIRVDELWVAGYVRPPRAYLESAFQQALRTAEEVLDLTQLCPAYRRSLGPMEQVFGTDRLRYWLFDPASLANGDVVTDFVHRMGIHLGDTPIRRVNEGLSRDAVSLLMCYRRFGPGFGQGQGSLVHNRLLHRAVAEVRGPKLRFHDDLVAPNLAAEQEDIAWMEARLGCSLAEPPQISESCIRHMDELLKPSELALTWLAQQVGADSAGDGSPQLVAQRMAQLKDRLVQAHEAQRAARRNAAGERPQPGASPAPQAGTGERRARGLTRNLAVEDLLAQVRQAMPPGDLATSSHPALDPVEAAVVATLDVLRDHLAKAGGHPVRLATVGVLRQTPTAKPDALERPGHDQPEDPTQ